MNEKKIYKIFRVSLILKITQALIESVAGIAVLFTSTDKISLFLRELIIDELGENPDSPIYTYIYNVSQHFSTSDKYFFSFYLLSHGIVKAILIGGLIKNKKWAYPTFITIQGCFIVYQIYTTFHRHSIPLAIITAFDTLFLWLIWHEYKLKKKHKPLTELGI